LHHSGHQDGVLTKSAARRQSPLHGHIDDAVLDGYRTLEMISTGSKNAIFKTMKLGVTTAHVRMFHRGRSSARLRACSIVWLAPLHAPHLIWFPCAPFVQPPRVAMAK
jgi:hypothetical protein